VVLEAPLIGRFEPPMGLSCQFAASRCYATRFWYTVNDIAHPRWVTTSIDQKFMNASNVILVVILGCLLVAGAEECSAPPAAQRIKEQYPDAQFEARLTGCTTPGASSRRFGSDAQTALLWSREQVKSARYFPCTALIRAVSSGDTTDVYRVSLTRDGKYDERILAPK